MPGPTPTHLKLLRGNPIRRPILSEPEPERPPECPSPPDYLHGYAKQPNPMIGIARNAAADALKIAGEFGLTPAPRSRLAASLGGRSGDGKFEGLLG